MLHSINHCILLILRIVVSALMILVVTAVWAQETLPSLPSLDDFELPELSMIHLEDDDESVSRPNTTPKQAFNKELSLPTEDNITINRPQNTTESKTPLESTQPSYEENATQAPIPLPTLPDMSDNISESRSYSSWIDTIKNWIGWNKDEQKNNEAKSGDFKSNATLSETMSEIDVMISSDISEPLILPAIEQETLPTAPTMNDFEDDALSLPSLDNLDSKANIPTVLIEQEQSVTPIKNTEQQAVNDSTIEQDSTTTVSVPTTDSALLLPTEAEIPPQVQNNIVTPNYTDDHTKSDEGWFEMFARWWHSFKLWIGMAEEPLNIESDLAPEEFADEDLDLFNDLENTIDNTQNIDSPKEDIPPNTHSIQKLDVTATETIDSEPEDSTILHKTTLPDTKKQKIVEEDPLVKELKDFIYKETIVLLMRDDDVTMGQITETATNYYMHPVEYIKKFWKAYEWDTRMVSRYKTQKFIDYYYTNNRSKIISQSNQQELIQQYTDNILNAVYTGDLNVVRTLLENYPELLDVKDIYGNNLLHIAVYKKHYDLAKLLIMNGIEVDPYNEFMETPLDMTTENGVIARLLHRAL